MDLKRRNLLLECSELQVGETSYEVRCPSCMQKSFSVTRNSQGILFNCFRVKCKYRGFIPTDPTYVQPPTKYKVKEYKPIETITLTDLQKEFFNDKFGIPIKALDFWGVQWAPDEQRVVFPIRDYLGREIGRTLRGYPELGNFYGRKTLHYKYSDSIPFAYYSPASDVAPWIVIVEDPVSCIKVHTAGYNCIALLGTNFSSDLVKFLQGKSIMLWLDNDALTTAVKYKEKYRMFFKHLHIVASARDPKDTKYPAIQELLRWYGT